MRREKVKLRKLRVGLAVVAFGAAAVGVAVSVAPDRAQSAAPPGAVAIYPADNEQSVVNNQPPGTAFALKSGTHYNFAVKPKRGQRFYAESGTTLDGNGTTAYAFYHDNAGDRPDGVVIAGESKRASH